MLWRGVESFRSCDGWVVDKYVAEAQDLGDGDAVGADGTIDDVVEVVHSEALEGDGIHQPPLSHVEEKVVMH